MKKMNRIAAMLVAFAVVVSTGIFSVFAYAEDTAATPTTIEITESDLLLVEKLEAFGIVKDINADLTANVTRREMAEIITDYMRIPDASIDYDGTPFYDVPATDPSIGSIMALYNMKIVTGDENGRFNPDATLNYDEALVFVVNAVGYKLFAVRDGGFPTGYHRVAISLGMLKNLAMQSGRDTITRLDVYRLMEAGLRASAVTYGIYTEDEIQYTVSATEDFLSDTHGITTHKGIITGNEDTYLTNATSKMTDEQIEIDYTLYDTPGYIYATSLGRSVIYYLRDDNYGGKEIAYIEENDALNSVVKVDSRDIVVGKTTDTRIYYTDRENKEYHVDFADAVDVIYNGRVYRGYGNISNALPAAGYIEALDNNGDGAADIMFVYAYRNVLVKGIDTYKNEIIASDNTRISCDEAGGNARVYVGPEMFKGTINHVGVDSIISVMESVGTPKLTTICVSTEEVTGTISEVHSDGTIVIDGTSYTKAVDYTGDSLNVGKTVSLKLDYNGYIARGAYISDVNAFEIGVLAGLDYEQSGLSNKLQLRIYTKSKKFEIKDLANSVHINNNRCDLKTQAGMTEALVALSEGEMENGKYSVTEANLIRYRLEDDKISHIETPGSSGSLRIIDNEATNVLCRPTSQVLTITNDDDSKVYGVYDTGKIAVFAAPYNNPNTPENEISGEVGYAYGLSLNEAFYTNSTGPDKSYTENTALYSSSNNTNINHIDALLFRGSARAGGVGGIDIASPFYMITKVSSALGEDGESCKKLYFGAQSKMLADKVGIIDINGSHANLSGTDPLITGLKPGDVVQYATDATGRISGIRVISDYDKTTNTVTHQYNYTEYLSGTQFIAGVVTQNDPESRSVTIEAYNQSEGSKLGRVDGSIYIYYSADNKYVQATQAELVVGDKITAHIKTYHSLTEIFIIR